MQYLNNLDQLYLSALNGSVPITLREQEKTIRCLVQRPIMVSLVISFALHSVASLGRLLDFPETKVQQIVEKLYAIPDVSKNVTAIFRLHHPSFIDFFVKKCQCSDESFWIDDCNLEMVKKIAKQFLYLPYWHESAETINVMNDCI